MTDEPTPDASDDPSLYDSQSSPAPGARPEPGTLFTATKETLDNDREDVSDDVVILSD